MNTLRFKFYAIIDTFMLHIYRVIKLFNKLNIYYEIGERETC